MIVIHGICCSCMYDSAKIHLNIMSLSISLSLIKSPRSSGTVYGLLFCSNQAVPEGPEVRLWSQNITYRPQGCKSGFAKKSEN